MILIDLTQVGTESGGNIANDTWRWSTGDPAYFDLEFSSANGSHVDLDGGAQQGSEYHSGTEAATNHVYDVIRATFLGGAAWKIDALRGATTYALGEITEYAGSLSHAANYGLSGSESHLTYGPSDAGADSTTPSTFKTWFWLYRNTTDDTVSLNVVAGSGADGTTGDGGDLGAEFHFGGDYSGTLSVLAANDGSGELSLAGTTFTGNWGWDTSHDDGGSMGGIQVVPVPEPGSPLVLSLLLAGAMLLRRRGS